MTGKPGEHRCAARGCEAWVAKRLLMCKTHWFLVPQELRERVWYLTRTVSTRPDAVGWRAAMAQAVEAVAKAEAV